MIGGNQQSETARPRQFMAWLAEIETGVTVKQLADIRALPVMQQLEAMQGLGQSELNALDSIERLCNKEVAFLLQHLKPDTVASTLSQYKKVLDHAGLKKHPYQIYLKLPAELVKQRKETYRAAVMDENKNLKPVYDMAGYISKARQLLNDERSYMKIAMGLCALTGRRPAEILISAQFKKAGKDAVIFSGQLKTKDSEQARDNYEIPVLAPADEIIEALASLREKRDFSGLPVPVHKTLAQVVNARTAKQQGETVRAAFGAFIPDGLKAYALRAVYALICSETLRPETMTVQAYMAEILGHSENDSATAASYLDFYIHGKG